MSPSAVKQKQKQNTAFQVTSNLCLLINRAKEKRLLGEPASHRVRLTAAELFADRNDLRAREAGHRTGGLEEKKERQKLPGRGCERGWKEKGRAGGRRELFRSLVNDS